MNRKRLTREDSRELTTQRLLDAAREIIATKGLEGANVEDITAAAGYSRGAFYSNFASKSDLFVELLRRDHERTSAEFFTLVDDKLPIDHIQARSREIYGGPFRDHDCLISWTEARLLSARDPRFRAKINELMLEKRDQIGRFIEYFNRRLGAKPQVPPALMAMGFMSLIEGVRLSSVSSPSEMTPEAAKVTLALFMDSVMSHASHQLADPVCSPGAAGPAVCRVI